MEQYPSTSTNTSTSTAQPQTPTQSWIRQKYELDTFQSQAFEYIDHDINVLVCAPTGSGKTTVADYAIEKVLNKPNSKVIYTCPTKALSNEKYRDMVGYWGQPPFNKIIGLMTGDIIINPFCVSGSNTENGFVSETPSVHENNIVSENPSVYKENIVSENPSMYKDNIVSENPTENTTENMSTNISISENMSTNISNISGEIIVMTTEVLYKLLETFNPDIFDPCVIIFDEVHYINDDSRGHIWEKSLVKSLYLKTNPLLILLSATIGNPMDLIDWLNSINSNRQFRHVSKLIRPVPLKQYVIDNTKSRIFKKITAVQDTDLRQVSNDPDPESYELLELNEPNYNRVKRYWIKLDEYEYTEQYEIQTLCNQINSHTELGVPAIIFVLSKAKCEEYAQSLKSFTYTTHEEQEKILRFYDKHLFDYKTCSQYVLMRKIIVNGVGFHHSGLVPKIREVVEFLIKSKLIKFVFATETFAVGLNFPVKTVVVTGLTKPAESGGMRFLTVGEYKQMAGRAGRRFLDTHGNVIIWLYNKKAQTRIKSRAYIDWNDLSNITNGSIESISSKYIIEPNYVLKKMQADTEKINVLHTFKYYKYKPKSNTMSSSKNECPKKFSGLFNIYKKTREYMGSSITIVDKNYSKLYSKLSRDERVEYERFIENYEFQMIKTPLEIYYDMENSMIDFLSGHNFITNVCTSTSTSASTSVLTTKGLIASKFDEINPIIFASHFEHILHDSTKILPTLSMFVDDGVKIGQDEIIDWSIVEPDIIHWEKSMRDYEKFIDVLPKWKYFPKNYMIVKKWLTCENSTLNDIEGEFDIDLGTFVKILIKLYQMTDELLKNLPILNRNDLAEVLVSQKQLLIRHPLKIESLYVNL